MRDGGVSDAKPKYPPDASGGYNNKYIKITPKSILQGALMDVKLYL